MSRGRKQHPQRRRKEYRDGGGGNRKRDLEDRERSRTEEKKRVAEGNLSEIVLECGNSCTSFKNSLL